MKAAFFLLCLTATAYAQTTPAPRQAAACGPADTSFKVSLDHSQHGPLPLAEAKAQIYFIHDSGMIVNALTGYPTTKYGIDGSWVGAAHGNSWFAVSVAPGEHHICTTLQSSMVKPRLALAHFTAKAGKSYYFRTQLVLSGTVELLELQLLDSDLGTYLVSVFPMATATEKK